MTKIGLIGHGSRQWIAGVQYQQSLLAGNQLLEPTHRAQFDVFLHRYYHSEADYAEVEHAIGSIQSFDFYYGKPHPFLYQCYQSIQRAKQGRWQWPQDLLRQMLLKTETEVIFPANELLIKNSPVRQICWMPDFQHLHFPEYFTKRAITYRNANLAKAARLAQRVVVSNELSRDDAVRVVPEVKSKIEVLPFTMWLGEDWLKPDCREWVRKYGLPKKFLIFPSQWWVHKNHRILFEAIGLVKRAGLEDIALVSTGWPADPRYPRYAKSLRTEIQRQNIKSNFHELGLLPRADQVQLMRAACAIVQPSRFEGWSALMEESRALGKFVFASDIPMHHQHTSTQTVYFHPDSARELAALIMEWWPQLPSGPDLAKENAASLASTAHLKKFTQHFISLCQ